MSDDQYDVVIIGAGLVGSSLAALLQKENFKIAIIDKNPAPENSVLNFNSRAIALSWSSIQLLKKMGVWSSLEIEKIQEVQVSLQGFVAVTRLRSQDFDLPFLGAVVNADSLNFSLHQHLRASAEINIGSKGLETNLNNSQIDFFRNTEVKHMKRIIGEKNTLWEIELVNGKAIQTSLLVGADGSESFLRKHQGIGLNIQPQLQTAIVVNVGLNQSHNCIAYERFLKTGSIAMLPFGEKRVKSVWIIPNEELSILMEKNNTVFLETLQEAFGLRLGILTELGKRFAYPIQESSAEHVYGKGWVLIGNAANTLNPVAAQGFNLGLRDAHILAEKIIKTKKAKKNLDFNIELQNIEFLQAYAKQRLLDHAQVKHFTQQLAMGGLSRRLGVLACEWFSPLKQKVGRLGLGIEGR